MSAKSQHNNILLAIIGFAIVVILVAIIGFFMLGKKLKIVQGEIEVSEYRVSGKLPGCILELRVKESNYARVGDTLAILETPEVNAQEKAAAAQQQAAATMSDMADNRARREQIHAAYQLWQQALAAIDIAQKSYERVQNLSDRGVTNTQKRDKTFVGYKARETQVKAAKSQYDMAKNGAREEEKHAAKKQAQAAEGVVSVVRSLLKETVQISNVEGEVSSIYPKEGELVGTGSPIMSISIMKDLWGTFNIREDQLNDMKVGDTFKTYTPAFNKEINMKVFYIKDQGSYAVWKATKTNGQYNLKTFEVKARPTQKFEGLRPGTSLVIKEP